MKVVMAVFYECCSNYVPCVYLPQSVLCPYVECPGAILPEGECCLVCPNGDWEIYRDKHERN